jgi:hypothetical protein
MVLQFHAHRRCSSFDLPSKPHRAGVARDDDVVILISTFDSSVQLSAMRSNAEVRMVPDLLKNPSPVRKLHERGCVGFTMQSTAGQRERKLPIARFVASNAKNCGAKSTNGLKRGQSSMLNAPSAIMFATSPARNAMA